MTKWGTFLRIRLLFLQHFTLPRGPHQARPGEPASPKGSFCTVLLGGTIQPHGLYSKRSGRLVAAPTGVIPFIHTGYTRKVPGTAHRPFPTYFNGKAEMNNVGRPNNCPLSILHITVNCPLSTVNSPRVPANRTTAADTAFFPHLPNPCGPTGRFFAGGRSMWSGG